MIRPLATLAAALLIAQPALAWGEYGHRAIATIAAAELSPGARAAVAKILRAEPLVDTPTCPLTTIEDASYWPDCIRGLGDRFSYAAPWHYQNITVCEAFDAKAKCPDGNCISAQIDRHLRLVKSADTPPREKLMSFAWLVHFVGDMHQPLHSGDAADRGGNNVSAAYGAKAPDRMNLHRIWDSDLAERAVSTPPGGPDGLRAEISATDRAAWRQGEVADWQREAWQASRDVAYGKLQGVDVCAAAPTERVTVDEAYVAASTDTLRTAVKRAGVRLAKLLEDALGG